MRREFQHIDFAPKKVPSQRRSRETFDAIVEACTWLLPRRGYAGTTTNHIADRAGVNISSLYEYFPGKDAIVAQVAERLVQRVLRRLSSESPDVVAAGEDSALRSWLELIHETVAREKDLAAVFFYEVPYTNQLEPMKTLGKTLLDFSQRVRRNASGLVDPGFSDASLQLVINLVTSTIMQLVLDPPPKPQAEAQFDELVWRLEDWILSSRRGD